ncbi:MAG: pirin family protein [Gammaproteobacteria bacterium]
MRQVLGIYSAPSPHWVGDGFPVRSLFSYHSHGKQLSPFLLLDYAGPADFPPAEKPRGVGPHPHRGFETVTIVYEGEVAHRDSTGESGVIGPGDVQWMTAGAGILHEEFHSEAFTRSGGALEMVQLWVNLPAKDKMTLPAYQSLLNQSIPRVAIDGGAGAVRVIAGDYDGHRGPAKTFTPMQVWDIQLVRNGKAELTLTPGWNAALVVLHGSIVVNGDAVARDAQLAVLGANGRHLSVVAETDAKLLLLSGEPILEPIVGQGPFVMNNRDEIEQALKDFSNGRFGCM